MGEICLAPLNLESWVSNNCANYFRDNVNKVPQLFKNVFAKGIQEGNEVQYAIGDWCSNQVYSNGVCLSPLLSICAPYNRKSVKSPILRYLCGCYLSGENYLSVNRTCDSLCATSSAVPYIDTTGRKTCDADICVIDNITIETQGSSTGNLTFSQTCPNCGVGGCICIVSDIDIISTNTKLGNVNITQNCGDSICFDSNGTQVGCGLYLGANGYTNEELVVQKEEAVRTSYFGVAIIFITLLIWALIYSFS